MFHFAGNSVARLYACLYAALSLFSLATTTHGQTIIDWNDPSGGSYTDPFNWTGLNVPDTTAESRRFNVAGTFDVELGSGSTTTVSDLLVNSGDVTLAADAVVFANYITDDDVVISGGDLTLSQTGGGGDVRLTAGDILYVNNGGALTVELGSRVTMADLDFGTVGSGLTSSIIVDGSDSTFIKTGTTSRSIGQSNATGVLTFRNVATGDINGTLSVAGSANSLSAGFVNVESDADLELDSLNIGASGASTVANGNVTVSGSGSTITQTGASTLTIGTAAGNIGVLNVNSVGVFSTGTGATTVNATGSINIGAGTAGTFNANGDVNVNGGSITRTSGSFNLAAGRTLTASNDAQIDLGGATELPGGTTWNIQSGADLFNSGVMDIGDSGGDTTVTVDGPGSTLSATPLSTSSWHSNGHTAQVTIRNGALANVGGINLANSNVAGTTGMLAVESQATMNTTHITVAFTGGATTTGTITVSNATLTQTGSSTLTVGHASSGTATINVLDGGTFNTGTGTATIRATGSINIGDGVTAGTFNANGNVNVNGGSITRTSGNFNLASGRTFTASNNAQIDLGGGVTLSAGTTWNILSGADLFNAEFMEIAIGGDNVVTIDGVGSSLTSGGLGTLWGLSGHTAEVTVRNGASANVGGISLAAGSDDGTTGTIAVESGATMTVAGNLSVAAGGSTFITGSITVTGADSSLTQTGNNLLTLGHGTSGTATLNVLDTGTFSAGTGGTILRTTGTINIDGGFADLGPLDQQGGAVNFNAGSLSYGGDLTVGTGGLLGADLALTTSKQLALTGTTTIDSFRTLTLDGGSLSTGSLVVNGNFQFNAGTLNITGPGGTSIGAGGPLSAVVSLAAGQNLAVTNTLAVDSGATLVVGTGASVEAGMLANNGSVVLDGAAATLGGSAVSNSGLLRGEGTVSANVTNNTGGEIRAQAGKTLTLTGVSGPNEGRINLQGGTLDIAAALTNAAGGDVVGRGTLATGGLTNHGDVALSNGATDVFGDVDNETTGRVIVSGNADVTFWDDVTHAGALFNVATSSSATFFGDAGFGISGGGDVFFEADITPGSSPGLAEFGGNVHFGTLANLEIEIAGTTKGSEYDALDIAGSAALDGTLGVSLLEGFAPGAGDVFEILTAAGGITGTFAQEVLPSLAGGLGWQVNYGSNSVILEVAGIFSEQTTWTGTAGSDWNNAANWDAGVPDANDAFVGAGATIDTSADAPAFQRLNLQNTTGLLTIGHEMTLERLDDSHADLVGDGTSGNLRIISGGSLTLTGDGSGDLFHLRGFSAVSTATVDGGSLTTTDASQGFRVGGPGSNQDAIFTLNSGTVDIAGTVRVGSGGGSAKGRMDLNGGTFTYGGSFVVEGNRQGGNGGELNINGATVLGTGTNRVFSVGSSASTGQYGLVDLMSGSLELGTDTTMSVGPTGSSFAPASAGRLVISGGDFTAPGEATLVRISSFGNSALGVPTAAHGGLNQSGGTALIEGELRIGSGPPASTAGGTGHYIHRGGAMTVSNSSGTGLLRVAIKSKLVISGGTITADQFQIDAGTSATARAGELHGRDGTLVGPVNVAGILEPGIQAGSVQNNLPGTLNIHGDLTLESTAETFFDFKDPTLAAGSFDSILNNAENAVTFDGGLTLRFFGGEYQAGTVTIFDSFAAYSGEFDSFIVTGLTNGENATFNPANGTVTIAADMLLGDYNGNGVVDAADYVVWRKSLGQIGTGLAADGNGNGEIDPGDYTMWRANFGRTAGSGSAQSPPSPAAVPEPAALLLALLGAVIAGTLRMR